MASQLVDFLTSLGWSIVWLLVILVIVYLLLPVAWRFMAPRFNAAYIKDEALDTAAAPRPDQVQAKEPVVTLKEDGSYSVDLGPGRAFQAGYVEVHHAGEWFSSQPMESSGKRLILVSSPGTSSGSDELGNYERYSTAWKLEGTDIPVETRIDVYAGTSYVKFNIHFPRGLPDSVVGELQDMIFHYPAFSSLEGPNQRILAYQFSFFCPPTRNITKKGTQGPICFFDNEFNAVILGATDHFMLAFTKKEGDGRIIHGFEGNVKEIPPKYEHSVLLYLTKGLNKGFVDFCDILRKYHKVPRRDPYADPIVANLGFWTQNGAHYYYRKEKEMNYEETILYCKETFDKMDLPIQFFQMDSWWYQKAIKPFWKYPPGKWLGRLIGGGAFGGTVVWDAIPEEFPNGLEYLHEKTGWPFCAHARWFDPKKSPYIEKYDSIVYKHASLPVEYDFWDDLMEQSAQWGLKCYEQDWFKNTFTRLPQLQDNVYAVENWLTWMGKAAQAHDITLQYCMTPAGGFMYALKVPAVTNARTTGDYHARVTKQFFYPQFSQTNILAWAVGIWPSLDCYLTTTTPLSKGLFREKYPEQMTLLSNLGGGVICPSDKAERVNKPLLMKTCTPEGLLLKPDRPITANDLMFVPHEKPYIMNTWTKKGDLTWHYIFLVNLWPKRTKDFQLTLHDLGLKQEGILYDFFSRNTQEIQADQIIAVPLKKMQKRYWILAPYLMDGVALIGSPEKYVTAASKLFPAVSVEGQNLQFTVEYSPKTSLEILLYSRAPPTAVESGDGSKADWSYDNDRKLIALTIKFAENPKSTVIIKF